VAGGSLDVPVRPALSSEVTHREVVDTQAASIDHGIEESPELEGEEKERLGACPRVELGKPGVLVRVDFHGKPVHAVPVFRVCRGEMRHGAETAFFLVVSMTWYAPQRARRNASRSSRS